MASVNVVVDIATRRQMTATAVADAAGMSLGFGLALASVATVRIHDPEIITTTSVAREGDVLTVRGPPWLEFPCEASAQKLGLTAFRGQRPDLTEKVED